MADPQTSPEHDHSQPDPQTLPEPDDSHRICTGCKRRLPVECFRRLYKGGEKRQPRCNDCRRAYDRRKRRERNGKRIHTMFQDVRRRSSADAVFSVLQEFAGRIGGWPVLFSQALEVLQDPDVPPRYKACFYQTCFHMLSVGEQSQQKAVADGDEDSVLRGLGKLHRTGVLIPKLRDLLAEGTLGVDELAELVLEEMPSG